MGHVKGVKVVRELWKSIPGLAGKYQASNLGRIRSVKLPGTKCLGKVLSAQQEADGRYRVSIHIPAGQSSNRWRLKRYLVHRLVMLAFRGPCPKGHEVNHKDGVHTNNVLRNLEYRTKRYNYDHAVQHKLQARGTANGNHKLTTKAVTFIKENKGVLTSTGLAKTFAVSKTTICNIWKGKVRKDG